MKKNSTKEILMLHGYPEDEADEMSEEIDDVVRQSYMVAAIGFNAFRDVIIRAMFGWELK